MSKNKSRGRLVRARKPDKCPVCGFSPVGTILYGLPIHTDALLNDLLYGRVVLGGCCISGNDPAWVCTNCETHIWKRKPAAKADQD